MGIGRLATQEYGKSKVRLTKVTRHADVHELIELCVAISLQGDFDESYLQGDNRRVIATDTMKNTVYALAADHRLLDPEIFCTTLAEHFVGQHAHVSQATVTAEQTPWQRIATPQGPHRHAFVGNGSHRRTCRVCKRRDGLSIQAGVMDLPVLKTTDSAFKDFMPDEFRTLADTDDRIFATLVNASWDYAPGSSLDWNATYEAILAAMLRVFAENFSPAVQQTLFEMGEAALEVCPAVQRVSLELPNQHRIPVNLTPFKKPNRNEIFVTTSEPHGLISATVERKDIPAERKDIPAERKDIPAERKDIPAERKDIPAERKN